MAKFGYTFSGGAPVMKRFKIGASFSTKGILAVGGATGTAGLSPSTSAAASTVAGLTLDTSTYSTAQAGPEGVVTVIVNPDLVSKWHAANSTVSGTQLVVTTNSSASSGGTAITITSGDPAPNSPQMTDGTAICISGANTGLMRAITSTAATVATVTVPFPNAIASGDVFLIVPWSCIGGQTVGKNVNLTATFDEARQDIAVGTGVAMRPVEIVVDFSTKTNAQQNTYVLASSDGQAWNLAV